MKEGLFKSFVISACKTKKRKMTALDSTLPVQEFVEEFDWCVLEARLARRN